MDTIQKTPLAELHAHLGTSISAEILWQIAHQSGFKLPQREFVDFRDRIMLSSEHRVELNTYFREIYHPLLDKLSSGSQAVEQATYHTFTGAYNKQNITLLELRNNPLKHNKDGEFELDHMIMAMLRGMERALIECKNLSAGLIFCLAREFPVEKNAIILEKAIKYRRRGVVGIDVAGPSTKSFKFKDYAGLFDQAHKAGLKITVHTGEVKEASDIWEALEYARPQRIGHGIHAIEDMQVLELIKERGITLEVNPWSNYLTNSVTTIEEHPLKKLFDLGVKVTINSDDPEVLETNLNNEYRIAHEILGMGMDEIRLCNRNACDASFISDDKKKRVWGKYFQNPQ